MYDFSDPVHCLADALKRATDKELNPGRMVRCSFGERHGGGIYWSADFMTSDGTDPAGKPGYSRGSTESPDTRRDMIIRAFRERWDVTPARPKDEADA